MILLLSPVIDNSVTRVLLLRPVNLGSFDIGSRLLQQNMHVSPPHITFSHVYPENAANEKEMVSIRELSEILLSFNRGKNQLRGRQKPF